MTPLHPLVVQAAEGRLPSWAEVAPPRREHVARVSELMGGWAESLRLDEPVRARWRAAGLLHDALRDAPPELLRERVPPALAALPPFVLHGPAAAERLRIEGVDDGELLQAVAWHTLGHPSLGALGRALYAADFLDPGRDLLNDWRAGLRRRMPEETDGVVREIVAARIAHLLDEGRRVPGQTLGLWNSLAEGG